MCTLEVNKLIQIVNKRDEVINKLVSVRHVVCIMAGNISFDRKPFATHTIALCVLFFAYQRRNCV